MSINIHDNTVMHRGDAAIALTSESSDRKTPSQAEKIENNTGSDHWHWAFTFPESFTTYMFPGKFRQSTYPDSQHWGLLAYRQIYSYGVYPVGIDTQRNHFE